MKLTLLVCLILGVSLTLSYPVDHDYEQQWQEFKMTHIRKFHSKREELMRKNIFEKNARMVQQHNMQHERGLKSFAMKLNQFSDWTPEELSSFSGKEMLTQHEKNNALSYQSPLNLRELPNEVDWRKHNLVAPVRHQGQCGSCYAFSSLGALEGQVARKTGEKPVWLSPQNIVDCAGNTTIYNNNGCHGGNFIKVFNYVMDFGVDTETSYPYDFATEANECRYKSDSVGAEITNYVVLDRHDEEQLLEAVATVGPIAVAINSDPEGFRHYSHGVYDDLDFERKLTHGVLLVGYGTENGQEYWLLKNSWGQRWGDHGYVKILRGVNMLNVAAFAAYPLL